MKDYTIHRTFGISTISGWVLWMHEDGTPCTKPFEPVKVYGRITEKAATKLLKKKLGFNVVISSITFDKEQFEISFEDFIKYATPVANSEQAN